MSLFSASLLCLFLYTISIQAVPPPDPGPIIGLARSTFSVVEGEDLEVCIESLEGEFDVKYYVALYLITPICKCMLHGCMSLHVYNWGGELDHNYGVGCEKVLIYMIM